MDREEWFLRCLEQPDLPVPAMLDELQALHGSGDRTPAEELAAWLQSVLIERQKTAESVALLGLRVQWGAADPEFRAVFAQALADTFARSPIGLKYAASLGLDKGLPLPECLRRLRLLMGLQAGAYCTDKTWGFGRVARIDEYAGKVVIDFDRKAGHEMAFAYAAETLQLADAEHILVVKREAPERIAAASREQPDDIVRLTLRSYGPMPVQRLQEFLVEHVLEGVDWKTFWEGARKKLKTDPRVEIPAKRSDPIRLLDKDRGYDADWLAALQAERSMPQILDRIEAYATELQGVPAAAHLPALIDRLQHVLLGAGERHPEFVARAALASQALAIDPARIDPAPLAALLLRPGVLRAAAAKLSVRLYAPLLAFLGRQDHAAATVRLIEELGLFSLSLLGEAVDFLRTRGAEARCRERFQELVNTRQAKTTVYGWLAKHLDCYAAWDMGPVAEFPFLLLETLRHEYSGDLLKAANQLQELLTQKEWLKQALDAMNPMQRASWIGRLHALSAERSPLDAKSILARAILLFPELADVPTGEGAAATGGAAPRLTAWRSLKERQAQLARIANEEIPKNSRDIAQARSYGDLSENFEYKAAKEQQRLLLRRQAELEADLVQVRGTDFAEFPCERVGPGTLVRLSYPDGRTEHYAILGEWDQEPELGIISSASRLAQALAGRRTGDTCRVPGADQSLNECRIAEIGPLPETVRRWARGV